MIRIENLVKRYGDILALDHFNLEVKEGEIFGLLGPNGSGKTTAINCMLALLKYDRGSIRIMGQDMAPDNYEVKRQIGIVMQDVAVFEELSVHDNIDYFCSLYVKDKNRRKELVEEAIRFVGLEDYRKIYPKKLSGGLLRRLNIACGIAHKPRLDHHIHLPLYGRGGADLHQDCHYGSWQEHRSGNKGRVKEYDQDRGDSDDRGGHPGCG